MVLLRRTNICVKIPQKQGFSFAAPHPIINGAALAVAHFGRFLPD
jgi:hypothetical protein